MKGSVLEEILNAVCNGVSNMLNGKSWRKPLRGFRMVVAVLLECYILSGKKLIVELRLL